MEFQIDHAKMRNIQDGFEIWKFYQQTSKIRESTRRKTEQFADG